MLELYLVSDRSWLNDRPLEEDIEQAILGGVTMVQLREKNLTLTSYSSSLFFSRKTFNIFFSAY